jgi:hypothetical protein
MIKLTWKFRLSFGEREKLPSEHVLARSLVRFRGWQSTVTGRDMMKDEFMQFLVVHGFQLRLHGYIHEAIEGFHKYADRRGVRIIGAGAPKAPAREQVTGIPLQCNLLTFDPEKAEMTVQTRKKEKPNGAWSADARWGDKNDPKPRYHFQVPHYRLGHMDGVKGAKGLPSVDLPEMGERTAVTY